MLRLVFSSKNFAIVPPYFTGSYRRNEGLTAPLPKCILPPNARLLCQSPFPHVNLCALLSPAKLASLPLPAMSLRPSARWSVPSSLPPSLCASTSRPQTTSAGVARKRRCWHPSNALAPATNFDSHSSPRQRVPPAVSCPLPPPSSPTRNRKPGNVTSTRSIIVGNQRRGLQWVC